MRKTITALLAAAALAAVAAQPASADAPSTVTTSTYSAACKTIWQYGVTFQYGAWGNYIDGCTVSWKCPPEWGYCEVYGRSTIETQEATGNRVTLNQRTRSPWGHIDGSCSGSNRCTAWSMVPGPCPACAPMSFIRAGETASVQCNGVRDDNIPDSQQTLGRVTCSLLAYRMRG